MIANTNPKTGVRYGVVSGNSLDQDALQEFFEAGVNLTEKAAYEEFVADHQKYAVGRPTDEEEQAFWDEYECDEPCFELSIERMKLGLSWLGGAVLVWVYESPHTATARLCSPCVPNAGDLDNLDPTGFTCYTLPADWWPRPVVAPSVDGNVPSL